VIETIMYSIAVSIATIGVLAGLVAAILGLHHRASAGHRATVATLDALNKHLDRHKIDTSGFWLPGHPEKPVIHPAGTSDYGPVVVEKPYPIFDSWGDAQAWGERWAAAYPDGDPSPMPGPAPWAPKPDWEQGADRLAAGMRAAGLSIDDVPSAIWSTETHEFSAEVKADRKRDVKPRLTALMDEVRRYSEQLPGYYPIELLRDHHPHAAFDDRGARTVKCRCGWSSELFTVPVGSVFDRHLASIKTPRPPVRRPPQQLTGDQLAMIACPDCATTRVYRLCDPEPRWTFGRACPQHCSTCFSLAEPCPIHGWLDPVND
jgi:hypothetical protein